MASDPVRLFHVSDIHFGAEDSSALAWFAAEVAHHKPDAVICSGDLTMRARHSEYATARDWLGALAAPVVVEPGNHDMPYFNLIERFVAPYARYGRLRAAVNARLHLPGVLVVPMRTIAAAQWRLNWSKGHVSRQWRDMATSALRDAPGGGLKLVVCHHPLVEANTHSTASTRGGKAALAALAAAGADAVLSGHVHDAFDLTVQAGGRPIRMIGAGTLSERVRKTPPSYNRLEWSAAGGLKVEAHYLK